MGQAMDRWNCQVAHVGVNCSDDAQAAAIAQFMLDCFGIAPERDSPASVFAGSFVELVKAPGRGRCGHIAVATDDLPATRAYLEGLGLRFDDADNKYSEDGSLLLTYLEHDLAGFAVHLLQRAR